MKSLFLKTFVLFVSLSVFLMPVFYAQAALGDDLKNKILNKNSEVKNLEAEIESYKQKIKGTQGEKDTLKKALSNLELNKKLVLKDIDLTKSKIQIANNTILELDNNIDDLNKKVGGSKEVISSSLRKISFEDERTGGTLVSLMLASETLSDFLDNNEQISQFQKSLISYLDEVKSSKKDLEEIQSEKVNQKNDLLALNMELSGKKEIIEENAKQKSTLLKQTSNKESAYQTQLKERLAKKKALEAEINSYEDSLRAEIDPNSLPKTGRGVLSYPVSKVVLTQYFGKTSFATANSQVYSGMGHNGIDLAASVGTPIKASLSGTVQGTGNTDAACPGASYGKWILLRHANGLSTLYAHLSSIQVSSGQSVSTGDLIGLSGNTGYSTGPHLHFAVYASKAVSIVSRQSKACGTTMTLPVSPQNGYLNPLSFL